MNYQGKKVLNSERSEESRFRGTRVLILGLGLNQGGVGAARFFAKAGAEVKVTDIKTKSELTASLDELSEFPEISYTLGEHRNEDIDWADLIIRNPAIRPNNPYLQYAQTQGKKVEMDLSIFLSQVDPKKVIAVTGTKGKSTVASLIYEVLSTRHSRESGNPGVILAGNIGRSMLDVIPLVKPNSLVILELSSFQLQALASEKVSSKYAVITNVFPDHLNYHQNMDEYTELKKEAARYQGPDDFVFLNKDNEVTASREFLTDLKGKTIYFSSADLPASFQPQLPGEHNKQNFAAALAIAKVFDVDEVEALDKMAQFGGVEFRLQLVKEVGGVKIYNDSAATNPGATIEALKSLPNSIVITGGMNKQLSYIEMAKALDEYAKSIYFIEGDATEELKVHLQNQDKIMGTYNDLDELLTAVFEQAKSGDTIIFSPGATSFNFWQNEFDRGRKFNQALAKVISK